MQSEELYVKLKLLNVFFIHGQNLSTQAEIDRMKTRKSHLFYSIAACYGFTSVYSGLQPHISQEV